MKLTIAISEEIWKKIKQIAASRALCSFNTEA